MEEECQHPRVYLSESTRGAYRITATCEECGKSASDIAGWIAEERLRGKRIAEKKKRGRP